MKPVTVVLAKLKELVLVPAFAFFCAAASGAALAQSCELFPIALSAQTLSNAAPNAVLEVFNGVQPGNFGWASWGGSPSEPTLVASLTPPGNSASYVNPDETTDHQISVGDWLSSRPGVSDSKKVRAALDALKSMDIIVPVWDRTRGAGEHVGYRVAAFARIRLLSYKLPGQNRITARFLGYNSCGDQNRQPTVDAGADQTIMLPAAAVLSGLVSDDGLPYGDLLVTWSQISGAGMATFTNTTTAITEASFSLPGTYQLRLAVTDGDSINSDDVIINVNRENRAPTADGQSHTNLEDTAFSIILQGQDADGDALSYAVVAEPVFGALTGTGPNLTYTPKPDYNGPDSFTFKVRDGLLESEVVTNQMVVLPVNDPPVADYLALTNLEDQAFTVTLSGSDVEGSALTFRLLSSPHHGVLTQAETNTYTYVPHANYTGPDSFTFMVNDGELDAAWPGLCDLFVVSVNDAPEVVAGDDQIVSFPTNTVSLSGRITDDDFSGLGDIETFWTKVSGPGDVTFSDPTNATTSATIAASGAYVLRLTADDGFIASSDELEITVNAPPVVSAGADLTNTFPGNVTLSGFVTDDAIPTDGVLFVAWSKVSGPGTVIFDDPAQTNTSAAFSEGGTYTLRLTAEDGLASTNDEVLVAVNLAPLVDAGSDQTNTALQTMLSATVSDDGLPEGVAPNYQWTKVSGSGSVHLDAATNLATSVSFSEAGIYVLRLTASDSISQRHDEVVFAANGAPVVSAGADLRITAGDEIVLEGTVADDGLPAGVSLSAAWSVTSGIGLMEFGTSTQAVATARFHEIGTYTVRLTADDSLASAFDEATITVLPVNRAPTVVAGPRQLVLQPALATLSATVTDDGLPENAIVTSVWSKVSGPGNALFTNPTGTSTTAAFSEVGDYVLRLTADDTALSAVADVRVAVRTPAMNQPPTASAGADQVVGLTNVVMLAGSIADDGLPQGAPVSGTWSVVSGPGSVIFGNAGLTNSTAAFSALGTYVLRFTVSDTALSVADEVSITVYPFNLPPVVAAGEDQTVTLPDPELLYPNPFGVTNVNVSLSRSLLSVERWNTALGQPGFDGLVDYNSIAVGDELFVTGGFKHAGGVQAKGSARWNGEQWLPLYDPRPHLNDNFDPAITNIAFFVYDCGGVSFCNETLQCVAARGHEAFVGGLGKNLAYSDIYKDMSARWSGTGWESWVFKHAGNQVRVIQTTANKVYVGGYFAFQPTNATDQAITNLPWSYGIATWDGTNWGALGSGITDIRDTPHPTVPGLKLYNSYVTSLAVTTNGHVFAAGDFLMPTATGVASNVVQWDGSQWKPLGSGLKKNLGNLHVTGMALADNGDLYVGGTFTNAGGYAVRNVARWDGTRWWPLGDGPANGVNSTVNAIAIHGRDVFVGGSFSEAGGLTAWRIAKWNGQSWSPLGSGATNGTLGTVYSLATDDTGVYVGGAFNEVGRMPANNFATWEFNAPPVRAVELRGFVTDDGLPNGGVLTRLWTKISGPGEVKFADAHSAITTAAFSKAGTYVLRLMADDSALTALDEVTVTLRANQPPFVSAGADQVIGMDEPLNLRGYISDDGLPEGSTVHHVWQQIYGPGTVTFDSVANTNVTARFSQQGTYVLRLSANDSHFTVLDEVTVIVMPRNQPPSVYPGSFAFVTFGNSHTPNAVVTDDGSPTNGALSVAWSVVSGPGQVTFNNAHLVQPTVSFSTNGIYVLRLAATDSELTASGDVQITVNLPANNPPVVNAGPDLNLTNLVTRLQGSVTDDGKLLASALEVYWSRLGIGGTVTFANSNSPSTAVTFSQPGTYVLSLNAKDGTYTVSDLMSVTIPNLAPLIVNAGPDRTITLPTNSLSFSGYVLDSGAFSVSWSRPSGPGFVTSTGSTTLTPTFTFSTAGTHVFQMRVDDGGVIYTDTLTVVVAPSGNAAPAVSAGADQVLLLPANTITLNGGVTDDGLPVGSNVTALWTQVAGPSLATVSQPSTPNSDLSLPAVGTYLFRLSAHDGTLTNDDDVVITLRPAINQPPQVAAGADLTTRVTNTLALAGLVTDDALPTNGALSASWRELSGPGQVTFGSPDASAPATTSLSVISTVNFSLPGTYILRLQADDSEYAAADDLTVTVFGTDDNQPPVVNAGLDASTVAYGPFILSGSVSDDGQPFGANLAVVWSVVSGPNRVYFSDATSLTPYAQFTAAGAYLLRLTVNDSRLSAFDELTITVSAPTNQPPFVFAGLPMEVTRPAPALLQGIVLDDGLPIGYPVTATWSKAAGPGTVTFAPSANDPLALAFFSIAGEYTLHLVATDSQYTVLDEVTTTVLPGTNAPPYVNAGPDFTAVLAEPALLITTVSDDGLEEGLLEISWSAVSGPGIAFFSTVNGGYRATFTAAGEYTLRLTAHDGSVTNRDDVLVTVVDAGPPVAEILTPADGGIVTAPSAVIGTASSPILQTYMLEYRYSDSSSSSFSSSNWIVLTQTNLSITNGPLAIFDPTLLLNGLYELRLTATDTIGRTTVTDPVTVIVDRNLKLGHFTISFNDLAIPVAGLPIQVTRTYDSRAAAAGIQGDFGIGWTLDIKNVRLQKNRPLGRNWEGSITGSPSDFSLAYHLRTSKPRIVTITFPDGRVEKFQFLPNPVDQPLLPIDYPQWRFIPIGNTRGSLAPATVDEPDGNFLIAVGADSGPVELYDLNYFLDHPLAPQTELDRYPTLFRYTTPEGYRYLIDEIAGLQSVTDPNGNTLLVGTHSLTWTNTATPNGTSLRIAFQRDAQGHLTNIVDAAGHSMRYAYAANGNLITFTDRMGQTNGFTYTNIVFPHHLSGIIDARGLNVLQNQFAANGRFLATLDAAGHAIGHDFDLSSLTEYVTNRLGFVTANQYDALGRLIHKTDPAGLVTDFAYDEFDNLLSLSNAACSCATRYTYDDADNLTSATDELGRTVRYSYTPLRKVLTFTDADGNTTTNTYDAQGNLLFTRDPLGAVMSFTYDNRGQVTSLTDPRGGVTRFRYDDYGRLTDETNALGNTIHYTADANGRLLSTSRKRTLDFEPPGSAAFGVNGNARLCDSVIIEHYKYIVPSYSYDDGGHLIAVLMPDGITVCRNVYDGSGRVVGAIDQLGQETTTEYDPVGLPTHISYPDGTGESMAYDAEGQLTDHYDRGGRHSHFIYDANGRLTQVTYPDGRTVLATYDERGRLAAESDSCHGTTGYEYDAAGNRISATDPLGHTTHYTYNAKRACTSVTDALGRTTTMEYDALNRNTRITYPDGKHKTTAYLGRLITSITDELGHTSQFGYDTQGNLTSTTNALGQVWRFYYDELGNRVLETDPAGETTLHEYDDLGRRIRTVTPDGAARQFGYDALGRLTSTTDPAGGVSRFAYDPRNNLVVATNALGELTRFTYNAFGQRTSQIEPNGQTTQWHYDSVGRQTGTTYPNGSSDTIQYDVCSRISSIFDRAGGRTSYGYDQMDQVVSVTGPLNRTTTFGYDPVGNLNAQRDPAGQVTGFLYNNRNRRTGMVLPDGTSVGQTYDPSGRVTSFTDQLGHSRDSAYDANGRLSTFTDATGNKTAFTYDARGNLATVNDALGHATTFVYDENGRLKQTLRADGSSEMASYNSRGLVVAKTDALGNQTHYGYDALDRLTSVTNALGYGTQYGYDLLGRLATQTDANGRATTYEYDALGNLTRTIYADGSSESSAYDSAGRRIAWTDANGHTTQYSYDLAGQLTGLTNALNEVTAFAYDSLGQPARTVDALGRATRFEYDPVGRLTRSVFADGSFITYLYDAAGRRIGIVDEAGITNHFGYDAMGRLTSVTDALGNVTGYSYDAIGRLLSQTDANGHTSTYECDALGRRIRRTLPNGAFETFAYDLNGNLTNRVDFNGRHCGYEYDSLNQPVRKRADPFFAEPPVVWAYDAVGLRTNLTDAAGATAWRYDALDRPVEMSRTWSDSGTTAALHYGYDPAGNVTNVLSTSVNGAALAYVYDALNRLAAVRDPLNGAASYAYDPVGNVSALTRPNGLQTLYAYDLRNRATNVTTVDASLAGLSQYLYTYGPAGNRTGAAETIVAGGQTRTLTREYAYDALYRLTGEIVGGAPVSGAASYTYDAVGNRLTRSCTLPGLPNQSFTYDANDQLTGDTYDANGNTLISPAAGVTTPDVYDHADRLITRHTTLNSQPSTINYQYDGDGHRVGKSAGGVTTHFLVDDLNPTGWPQVLEEQTWALANPLFSTPVVTRVYSYGHAPLSQDQLIGSTWTATHFGYDAHGNVRYLSDATGHATDTFDYDAFGSLIARSGTTQTTRLFTGEEFDADLGLYHLRARYHNPATGRFWTRDSFEGFLGNPASGHSYAYAENDPVNGIDPSGHYTLAESMAVSYLAVSTRQMVMSLWSGVNQYAHGLGGGDSLKAVNDVEGFFIQGLSQHTGINLGRQNFFAAMQGAPMLLMQNPFTYYAPNDCFQRQVLGFLSDAPIYGCSNRHPVFTFDFSNDANYKLAENLAYASQAFGLAVAAAPAVVALPVAVGGVAFGGATLAGASASTAAAASATTVALADVLLLGAGAFGAGQFGYEQATGNDAWTGQALSADELTTRRYQFAGGVTGGLLATPAALVTRGAAEDLLAAAVSGYARRMAGAARVANVEVLAGMEGLAELALAKSAGNNLPKPPIEPRALATPRQCLQLPAPKQPRALLLEHAESLAAKTPARAAIPEGAGEYADVAGHHVHAKSGLRGHPTYDPDRGFSISQEFMENRGWSHQDMTSAQRRLFDVLASSGRQNSLREHTRIAVEALQAGGATEAEARALVAHSLRNLRGQGVTAPTRIPWN